MNTPTDLYFKDKFSMSTEMPQSGENKQKIFTVGDVKYHLIIASPVGLPEKLNLHIYKSVGSSKLVDITFGIGQFIRATLNNVQWNHTRTVFFLPRPCHSDAAEVFEVFAEVTWKDSTIVHPPTLAQFEFAEFLMNPAFSDVVIVIGGERLFAHKIILAAASPVLSAMLQTPMRESLENTIEIDDIKVEIMQIVLKFLYTSSDEDLGDFTVGFDVLKVAEKYEMNKLKCICEEKILEQIQLDNVLDIIGAADTYNAKNLKNACLAFMKSHKDEVKNHNNFKELCLTQPALMYEIVMKIFS